jgi:hypothetical protein
MATLTLKAAGGTASVASSWEPEEVPTSSSDIVLASTSGVLKQTGTLKCRSFNAENYKSTWEPKGHLLEVGTSTSNGGLALKLGTSAKIVEAGEIKFSSTSETVEGVWSGGLQLGGLKFENEKGKWRLEEKASCGAVAVVAGELNTNGQQVKCGELNCTGTKKRTLTLGASNVVVSGSVVFEGSGITLSAASSTIELTATAPTFTGNGLTYNKVVLAKETTLTGSNTFAELVLNAVTTKRSEIKGTLIAGSKKIIVTPTAAIVKVGDELVGVSIPIGAYAVEVKKNIKEEILEIEMSLAAARTVLVEETIEAFPYGMLIAEASVTTITTSLSTNGKSGELARVGSNVLGKPWKVKKTSGTVSLDYVVLRDSHAEGGATWEAKSHSIDAGDNTGWSFTDEEAALLNLIGFVSVIQGEKISGGALTQTSAPRQQLAAGKVGLGALAQSVGARGMVGGLKVGRGQLMQATAPAQLLLGGKVGLGVATQQVGVPTALFGRKVGLGSLLQTTALLNVLRGSKVVQGSLASAVGTASHMGGQKITYGALTQTSGVTQQLAGGKGAGGEVFEGALLGSVGFVQRFAANKVGAGSLRPQVALQGTTGGLKRGMGALTQTVGVRVALAGTKIGWGTAVQSIALSPRMSGTKVVGGALTGTVGFVSFFTPHKVIFPTTVVLSSHAHTTVGMASSSPVTFSMESRRTTIEMETKMGDQFYVGDDWDIEVKVTNTKTGEPGKPGEVKILVYSPAARKTTPVGEPKTLTASEVGEGVYEVTGVELTEAGQWLAVTETTAPYKGAESLVISVAEPIV